MWEPAYVVEGSGLRSRLRGSRGSNLPHHSFRASGRRSKVLTPRVPALRIASLGALVVAFVLISGLSAAQERADRSVVPAKTSESEVAEPEDPSSDDETGADVAPDGDGSKAEGASEKDATDAGSTGDASDDAGLEEDTADREGTSASDGVATSTQRQGTAYGELSKQDPSESPVNPSEVGQSDVVLEATSESPPKRRRAEKPSTRWSEVGGFVGMVNRNGGGDNFRYGVGMVYGGYFRPQITSWLGVRLYYRQESIPVEVRDGGFDVGDTPDLDFSQPNLSVTSLGLRIEPTWNLLPRVQLMGILGWGWMRFVAEMPTAPGFEQEADRAAVELNWGLGAGLGVDVVKNWVNLNVKGTYSFITNQTGSAYENDIQAIVDGRVQHLGPLDRLGNPWDLLISLGVIL